VRGPLRSAPLVAASRRYRSGALLLALRCCWSRRAGIGQARYC